MARYNDKVPVKETCPLIDSVIDFITDELPEDELTRNKEIKNYFVPKMEEIRKANSTLREWGNEQQTKAEELEEELTEVKKELDSASDSIESYREQINDLENELSAANKRIAELEAIEQNLENEIMEVQGFTKVK